VRTYLTSSQLFLLRWNLDQPGQEAPILNQWKPLCRVPVHIFQAGRAGTWLAEMQRNMSMQYVNRPTVLRWHHCSFDQYIPTQQHNNRLGFGRYETKKKHIARTAVVALQDGFAERTIGMQTDLLVLGTHEMVDDVRAGCVATTIAKPLSTRWVVASNHRCRTMDSTVSIGAVQSHKSNQSLTHSITHSLTEVRVRVDATYLHACSGSLRSPFSSKKPSSKFNEPEPDASSPSSDSSSS
jgi:hypothetical protein